MTINQYDRVNARLRKMGTVDPEDRDLIRTDGVVTEGDYLKVGGRIGRVIATEDAAPGEMVSVILDYSRKAPTGTQASVETAANGEVLSVEYVKPPAVAVPPKPAKEE